MILTDILDYKKIEVSNAKRNKPFSVLLKEVEKKDMNRRDFRATIKREAKSKIHLIAEVKKASPSQGILRQDFDPIEIAEVYAKEGANAISVLTDERFFQGHLSYLGHIKEKVKLPLMRKDFIIDEYQIWEAANAGADAILLIVAALHPNDLKKFYKIAINELDLSVLVEVHGTDEVDWALETGSNLIGINNRDLRNFNVNLSKTMEVLPLLPKDCIKVSESGIKTRNDVEYLSSLGIDALLIGETFMRSPDIAAKIQELFQK